MITPKDRRMINRVLDSNRLSYGPMSRRFERRFAALHDSKFAVFTNSGTSALHLAVQALKEKYRWNDHDEVLVPSVTFVATANVVIHNNLRPIFVDVDPQTYTIDPVQVKASIGPRTRAIIPVHLLGLPADMEPLTSIARRNRLAVIEDSAETMFASYKGRKVGSFGEIGCFSTYVAHYIVTGVGGINTTSDPGLAVVLRSLANHGRDSIYLSVDDNKSGGPKHFQEVINRRFHFVRVGHSFRATELEAALGLSQLERAKSIVRRRKAIASRYLEGLNDLREYLQLPFTPPGREHTFMLFGLVTKGETKRELVSFLENKGIETRDLLPITNQPIYQSIIPNPDLHYPIAHWLNDHGFYIGCHQYLNDSDVDYVIEKFHEFFRR